jgi:hypothetical protein
MRLKMLSIRKWLCKNKRHKPDKKVIVSGYFGIVRPCKYCGVYLMPTGGEWDEKWTEM